MTDHSRPTEGVDHAQASRVAHTLNLGADGLPPRDLQTLARAYLNACLILESIAESIAAARAQGEAEERARCVAVVEKAQRYEGETRFGLSGHTMERNEWGDWLDRDSTLAALRGTEEG